jgi:hypothetical protein
MTDTKARPLPLPDTPPTPAQLKASLVTLGEWCFAHGYMEMVAAIGVIIERRGLANV